VQKYFGDDFKLNQVTYQHLIRSGGGYASPASPPCVRSWWAVLQKTVFNY